MGLDKLTALWNRIRDSLWFIPTVLTLSAVLLAMLTVQIDIRFPIRAGPIWLFSGTAVGARGVLGAIASGLITVTGVVFSVTIVALQLASTQFTPRVLRNFTADRANQMVLGVFIGTFTYALLVQRVVRGSNEQVTAFVPSVSVSVAVVLTMVSIGFLIFYIDHAARSVQASVIIDRVASETLATAERTLSGGIGEPAETEAREAVPGGQGGAVVARDSGYVQGMDEESLMDLIRDTERVIRLEVGVGDFVLPGVVMATVWPAGFSNDDPLAEAIRDAYILGFERTPHQDLKLGLIELVDIAVKALSPGINDPTTATLCLDRICEVLADVGRRDLPGRVRRSPEGGGILIVPRIDFDHLVDVSVDQIRHFGVDNPAFAITLLETLRRLGTVLPHHRHPVLARQAAALLREARENPAEPSDLARVEEAGRATLAILAPDADLPSG